MARKKLSAVQKEISRTIRECPPPKNLLPIDGIFVKVHRQDDLIGLVELQIDLDINDSRGLMPNLVRLTIQVPDRVIFSRGIGLSEPQPKRRRKRKQLRTFVVLDKEEFAQIWNNPDAEIIFTSSSRKSSFPIYI